MAARRLAVLADRRKARQAEPIKTAAGVDQDSDSAVLGAV
jgi:hypothetical protein